MRWVLRRHHLEDDDTTRKLFREFILSAFHVAQEFSRFVDQVGPRAVIVFNGSFFPEAMVRFAAQKKGIPVITHEVGLRPFAAFFTYGQATAYPLDIPDNFQLNEEENNRLDQYLEKRFKGDFSMAGIKFWKGMSGLGGDFEQIARGYRQIVPVFTNVIFDTSQPHSNIVFDQMFAWLGVVVELARQNRDTLFVLRAHPDEGRLWKESRESVTEWVEENKVDEEPNILFVGPEAPLSSYELITRSKFVMIYNSTIGLEASILGVPVLCAGKARFTQLPTVFFPQNAADYLELAEKFLVADSIEAPAEFQLNARRFLFYQMFYSSLPFDHFLQEDGIWPGFTRLKNFDWEDLTPQKSAAIRTIYKGLIENQDFILTRDEVDRLR